MTTLRSRLATLYSKMNAGRDDQSKLAKGLLVTLFILFVMMAGSCIIAGISGGAPAVAKLSVILTTSTALVGTGCRLWAHGMNKLGGLDGFGKGLSFFAAAAAFVFAVAAVQLNWK